MKSEFATIVLGLGAMGSATVYQLARRGAKVLGIDQYSPPHHYGSTHGESRIIRKAIGEGEQYMALVLRSYELWREIERETEQALLTTTGGLILETRQSEAVMHGRRHFLDQTISCAEQFNIRHEILETQDIEQRFPQFAVTNERGYFEYDAGYLRPESCIEAQLRLAKKCGATIQMNEKVVSITPQGNSGVTVTTDRAIYQTEKLVVSAGPWLTQFLPPEYGQFFKVYRQVMCWFGIKDDFRPTFALGRLPIFIWIFEKGGDFGFYGFPTLDGKTVKVAREQYTVETTPDHMDRAVSEEEKQILHAKYIRGRLPGLSNQCDATASCLYTTTPDANFVIDFLPGNDQIIVASPCSGHGFKHSAAIGEVISELILAGKSKIDISHFTMKRFTA